MSTNHEINYKGQKVVVAGLGISGYFSAKWLALSGAMVTVSDKLSQAQLKQDLINKLRDLEVRIETGGHKEETFTNADLIIISPGIPGDIKVLQLAANKGIPVIGEMEFAASLINIPMIAVTGTNGKTTVTEFIGMMLKDAGFKVFVGGNIGIPLMAHVVMEKDVDLLVLELSSYQLDTIDKFSPFVSIILNISPDHLDRYPDYESYVQSKFSICKNQGDGEILILNDDDPRLHAFNPSNKVKILRFGMKKRKGRHAYLEDRKIKVCLDKSREYAFSLDSFTLTGDHNILNLIGAVLCGLIILIKPDQIRKSIAAFKGLPNRLEQVGVIRGVTFINDSKATNVDAAIKAVMSFTRPLILIAGGRSKGADYMALVKVCKGRVKKAILMGETRNSMASAFNNHLPVSRVNDMKEAVSLAFSEAKKGDMVLLAPACSSFDMFSDYIHRGRVFSTAVKELYGG